MKMVALAFSHRKKKYGITALVPETLDEVTRVVRPEDILTAVQEKLIRDAKRAATRSTRKRWVRVAVNECPPYVEEALRAAGLWTKGAASRIPSSTASAQAQSREREQSTEDSSPEADPRDPCPS